MFKIKQVFNRNFSKNSLKSYYFLFTLTIYCTQYIFSPTQWIIDFKHLFLMKGGDEGFANIKQKLLSGGK